MGIRPNLVVGAVGLVVFLAATSIIVSQWNVLTSTHVYDGNVLTDHRAFPSESGEVQSGATQQETIDVPHENVTSVRLEVTWREDSGITSRPQQVTVTLRDPQRAVIGSQQVTAGERLIVIERALHVVPEPATYKATEDANSTEAAKRFPSYPETSGQWTITLSTQGGTGTIEYVADLSVDYYTVTIKPRPTQVPR